jgi:hypothetical protein
MNAAWKSLCLPAKVFPIGMTSLVLFDIFIGNYKNTGFHVVSAIMGTVLLYALCAFNMEIVAWILLGLPLFFFIALAALVIFDLGLIDVTHTFQQRCYPDSVNGTAPPSCK